MNTATATELIAHLEAGGLIARGDPRHIEFLRFEIYGENRVKHLGIYGWGSALGRVEDRLMDVLRDPHEWVCVPLGTAREAYESAASELLAETGEYVDYDWRLTLWDARETNTPTPQTDLLTTIRQEERRAVFKDCITELCIDCAEGEVPTFDEKARWYYHYAGTGGEVGCSASKLRVRAAALEAAANEK